MAKAYSDAFLCCKKSQVWIEAGARGIGATRKVFVTTSNFFVVTDLVQ